MEQSAYGNFFKNLFTALSGEKGARIFEKKSLLSSARELGATKEDLTLWFTDWSTQKERIFLSTSPAENFECICMILAALVCDERIAPECIQHMQLLGSRTGVGRTSLEYIFLKRDTFIAESSLVKRTDDIARAVKASTPSVKSAAASREQFYIANQVTLEGLDELQRLILAYQLNALAAIDGPPGTGKTRSVIETAKILRLPLFTKNCSSRTLESHIISHPVLTVQDGVSVTAHINGPLAHAMEGPGIFYGDEFNLLKEDVQKRLNSAFDDRRSIDRNDGSVVQAKPGFWSVISYNPTQSLVARDLEDSVADRFAHIHFERWSPDFKAYVSALTAQRGDPLSDEHAAEYGIVLGWRGISAGGKFFRGDASSGTVMWRDFFSGKEAAYAPEYIYRVYDRCSVLRNTAAGMPKELESLAAQAFKPVEFARMISRFTDLLQSLARSGKSPMLKKIGLGNLAEEEDLEILSLHECSTRIESLALAHYHELVARGFNRYLAQSYAVRLVIDQACYGQYRDKKLRSHTAYSLVVHIANAMRLFADNNSFNTSLQVSALLKS